MAKKIDKTDPVYNSTLNALNGIGHPSDVVDQILNVKEKKLPKKYTPGTWEEGWFTGGPSYGDEYLRSLGGKEQEEIIVGTTEDYESIWYIAFKLYNSGLHFTRFFFDKHDKPKFLQVGPFGISNSRLLWCDLNTGEKFGSRKMEQSEKTLKISKEYLPYFKELGERLKKRDPKLKKSLERCLSNILQK